MKRALPRVADDARSVTSSTRKNVSSMAKADILSLPIEEKRKLYKCGNRYTELSSIPTWATYGADINELAAIKKKFCIGAGASLPSDVSNEGFSYRICPHINEQVSMMRVDITTLEIDAIVNAANQSLMGGGGVDGAIHAAAGSGLRGECSELSGCNTGDAKTTGGYKLPAKYIIHTVGPRGENKTKLASCYKNCLLQLKENHLKTVSFPCISTGIYGYPNLAAAHVALSTVRNFLEHDEYGPSISRVIFCLFLPKDVDIYHDLMNAYFPLTESPSGVSTTNSNSRLVEGPIASGNSHKASLENVTREQETRACTNMASPVDRASVMPVAAAGLGTGGEAVCSNAVDDTSDEWSDALTDQDMCAAGDNV